MAYATRGQIANDQIPDKLIRAALADSGDGTEDPSTFAQILANISREIDTILEPVYPVPVFPVPACVTIAAILGIRCAIFRRRNIPDKDNFFLEPWKAALELLKTYARGANLPDVTPRAANIMWNSQNPLVPRTYPTPPRTAQSAPPLSTQPTANPDPNAQ